MRNVLVVGDLHIPFTLDTYREFCIEIKKKYKCNEIIFIGDILDFHQNSYHEHDPDGLSQEEEFERSLIEIQKWYKSFPDATITLGNHDLLIERKRYTVGLSRRWIKPIEEVLQTPRWKFVLEHELDGVIYLHGTGTAGANAAWKRLTLAGKSVVMGHVHSEAGIRYNVMNGKTQFAMMVGCGIDDTKYAFQYARNFPKKSIISCGLVLNNGSIPMVIPYTEKEQIEQTFFA
jgi:metallophosphoesterase superfamily enzyme